MMIPSSGLAYQVHRFGNGYVAISDLVVAAKRKTLNSSYDYSNLLDDDLVKCHPVIIDRKGIGTVNESESDLIPWNQLEYLTNISGPH